MVSCARRASSGEDLRVGWNQLAGGGMDEAGGGTLRSNSSLVSFQPQPKGNLCGIDIVDFELLENICMIHESLV